MKCDRALVKAVGHLVLLKCSQYLQLIQLKMSLQQKQLITNAPAPFEYAKEEGCGVVVTLGSVCRFQLSWTSDITEWRGAVGVYREPKALKWAERPL